jgi:hypothetical protein
MRSEEEKRAVLDRAGALRGSRLDNISVGPDVTKMQRRAEEKLIGEAESRNNQQTAEDREKNLKWLVVGRRGENIPYLGNIPWREASIATGIAALRSHQDALVVGHLSCCPPAASCRPPTGLSPFFEPLLK